MAGLRSELWFIYNLTTEKKYVILNMKRESQKHTAYPTIFTLSLMRDSPSLLVVVAAIFYP